MSQAILESYYGITGTQYLPPNQTLLYRVQQENLDPTDLTAVRRVWDRVRNQHIKWVRADEFRVGDLVRFVQQDTGDAAFKARFPTRNFRGMATESVSSRHGREAYCVTKVESVPEDEQGEVGHTVWLTIANHDGVVVRGKFTGTNFHPLREVNYVERDA